MLRNRERRRTGSATVECAFVLPVFVLLTLGTIEVCRAIYLRQAAKVAAYEAARVALVPGAELAHLELQSENILGNRGIEEHWLEIDHPLEQLVGGDLFTISVHVPFAENSVLSPCVLQETVVCESVTVMMEGF